MTEEKNNASDNFNDIDEKAQVKEAALPDAETAEEDPIAKLEAQLSESKDKYLRLYSDFENYKKRMMRDRLELIKGAGAETMLAILPVIDDLERAIKALEQTQDAVAIKEGLQLVYQKIRSVTENRGLKPMETVGKPFDSDLHDAVTNIQAPAEDLKNKVVEEIQKGYYLNDKVIRHAQVIVGN